MRASSVNQIILKTLEQDQSHLTAQQIYGRIRDNLPAVNQSTVYRALERLAHAGQVSVSDMGLGAAVYEAVGGEQHHHLVCQHCHRIEDLESAELDNIALPRSKWHGFAVSDFSVQLVGLCPDCRKNLKSPA